MRRSSSAARRTRWPERERPRNSGWNAAPCRPQGRPLLDAGRAGHPQRAQRKLSAPDRSAARGRSRLARWAPMPAKAGWAVRRQRVGWRCDGSVDSGMPIRRHREIMAASGSPGPAYRRPTRTRTSMPSCWPADASMRTARAESSQRRGTEVVDVGGGQAGQRRARARRTAQVGVALRGADRTAISAAQRRGPGAGTPARARSMRGQHPYVDWAVGRQTLAQGPATRSRCTRERGCRPTSP